MTIACLLEEGLKISSSPSPGLKHMTCGMKMFEEDDRQNGQCGKTEARSRGNSVVEQER